MKIRDILREDQVESNDDIDAILETKYFKDYILPLFKKVQRSDIDFSDESAIGKSITYLLKKSGIMYHGTHKEIPTFQYVTLKKRSMSQDTPKLFHNLVNMYSKKVFGTEIRNLLFASQNLSIAHNYSADDINFLYVIIPDDTYTLYISDKYKDMFIDYLRSGQTIYEIGNIHEAEFHKKIIKEYPDNEDLIFDISDVFHLRNIMNSGSIDISESDIIESLKMVTEPTDELIAMTKDYISGFIKDVAKLARDYIETVKETKEPPTKLSDHNEIMVDADGFYAVKMLDLTRLYDRYSEINNED